MPGFGLAFEGIRAARQWTEFDGHDSNRVHPLLLVEVLFSTLQPFADREVAVAPPGASSRRQD
jgi:hypothetical protein